MKDCNQCGKCCIKYGGGDLATTADEISHWEEYNPEIFKYVKGSEIWFDPLTGKRLATCPFMKPVTKTHTNSPDKYTCTIYPNRPEDCRLYPSLLEEMIRDECEMIEQSDLRNPDKARRELQLLMSDSRHPG